MRHAVRVLLIDEDERVFLFLSEDGRGMRLWGPPGGGIEPGEDARAAAIREVREETGLAGLDLGPEIWRRRHVFRWREHHLDHRERWFMARVGAFAVDDSGWSPGERRDIRDHRWWTLDDLRATSELVVPRRLADGLAALLTDGPPAEPIDIGV